MIVVALFDHLVGDVRSPLVCSFRVACKQITDILFAASDFSLFEDIELGDPGFDAFAHAIADKVCAKETEDERTRIAQEIQAVATALFHDVVATCKPRSLALEWIVELVQTHGPTTTILLVTRNLELAKGIWQQWLERLDALKFHAEAKLLEQVRLISVDEARKLKNVDHEFVAQEDHALTEDPIKSTTVVRVMPNVLDPFPGRVKPTDVVSRGRITQAAWTSWIPIKGQTLRGRVIHGFKRGSTELGIPTANLDAALVFGKGVPSKTEAYFPIPGVYSGWCALNIEGHDKKIYGCVLNAGYCPFYENEAPTLETHVFHEFAEEFYGAEMAVQVTACHRAEGKFSDFVELVEAIQNDCEAAIDLWQPWSEDHKLFALQEPSQELKQLVAGGWTPPQQ